MSQAIFLYSRDPGLLNRCQSYVGKPEETEFNQLETLSDLAHVLAQNPRPILLVDGRESTPDFSGWQQTRQQLPSLTTIVVCSEPSCTRHWIRLVDYVMLTSSDEELNRHQFAQVLESARLRQWTVSRAKMMVLAEVMAGVLHEIKNPLNNIVASVERLQHVELDGDAKRWSDMLARNAEILRGTVTQLLGSLREDQPTEPVNLLKLLDDAAEFALKGDPNARSIQVIRDYCGDACTINAVSGQLLHVFLNLIVNAKQAIGVGKAGQITLRCKSQPEQVVCEIEDSGPGLPPGFAERNFEPFFTTKKEGSGLGLSLANRLANANGGKLSARNSQRGGAVFCVAFPHPS